MFLFRKQPQNYGHVTADEYQTQYLEARKAHTLVDVRTQGEYRGGHVPGAVNIPLDELDRRIGEIPQDKPVIVICASGSRSLSASSFIAKTHAEVFNFKGGTMAWQMRGGKVVS